MKTYVLKHFSSFDVLGHLDRNLLYRLFARSTDYFAANSLPVPDSVDTLSAPALAEYAENFKHPFFDSGTTLLDDLEQIETMSSEPYSELALDAVSQNNLGTEYMTDEEHQSINTALYLHVTHHEEFERIIDAVRMDNPKSFRTLKAETVSNVFNDSPQNIAKFAKILEQSFELHRYSGGVNVTMIPNKNTSEYQFLIRRGAPIAREAVLDKANNLGGIYYCKANWDALSYTLTTGELKYSIRDARAWTTLLYPRAFGSAFFGNASIFTTERICNFDVLISQRAHALRCLPDEPIVVAKLTKAKFRVDKELSDNLLNDRSEGFPLYDTLESTDVFEAMRVNRNDFPQNKMLESIKIRFEFKDGKKESVSLSLTNNKAGIPRNKYGELIESWLIEREFFKCTSL